MSDNRDPVLIGHAVEYDVPIHGGRDGVKMFRPGCFTEALQRGSIAALHDHDWSQEIGETGDDTLQFDDGPYWLRFRVCLGDKNSDRLAAVMLNVINRRCNGASVGWVAVESHRDRNGVLIVTKADLDEVSVLRQGRCKGAYTGFAKMDLSKLWPVPRKPTPKAELKYQTQFPRYAIALGG